MAVTKIDPQNGERHSVSHDRGKGCLEHVVSDRTGRRIRLWRIDVDEHLVIHDLDLTEQDVVIYGEPSGIGVMPRTGGPVRWFPDPEAWERHSVGTGIASSGVVKGETLLSL